ncbi:hypothetical protein BRADI_4g22005v3 [Brachypodium distachyon]|uniref:Uncharacterized protein n=1 Tax=Brachypodium distachyon TaxID=15368 RepID=I1IMH1_BRADI|nr:hypothetical protein BRADI_4g22005v3 [Brachypodium distachyon]
MSAAVANPPGAYFVGHPTHPEEQKEPHPVDNQNAANVQASGTGAYYSGQPLGLNAADGANVQASRHDAGNLTEPSAAKKKRGSFAKLFSGCFSSGEVAK